MEKDPQKLEKAAEEFADRMEAVMRDLGSTGDYFCESQRERWRKHAIRAFLGESVEPEAEKTALATTATSRSSRK